MKIIKGKNLDDLLSKCSFELNPHLKQISERKYPANSGILMLTMKIPPRQTWVLENEVEKSSFWSGVKSYFEFEIIDAYDSQKKLYIPTEEFIPVLESLSKRYDAFNIERLYDTIGLRNNPHIKRLHAEYKDSYLKRKGLDKLQPRDYYDNKYGSKTEEEMNLNNKAKEVLNQYGTPRGSSKAIEFYSKVININHENAYAYFNRGLAILDDFSFNKNSMIIERIPSSTIEEEEASAKKKADADFKKAIELHPYLIQDYDNLKSGGRIY
jgi:hypothetical protein